MNKEYVKYEDKTLVNLLMQDNEHAFIEIYKRYWDKMYNVACNKLYQYYLAQEIVQNIFISLWERRKVLNIQIPLNVYLAAALKYQIINARQKIAREKSYLHYIESKNFQDQNTTENQLSFKELQNDLARVVISLPAQCQLVYKLKKEDGLSTRDIANKLGISEKAVEANFTRAIKKIKNSLKDKHIYNWALILNQFMLIFDKRLRL